MILISGKISAQAEGSNVKQEIILVTKENFDILVDYYVDNHLLSYTVDHTEDTLTLYCYDGTLTYEVL